MAEYTYEKDADGIVTVTFDASGKSANTMTDAWLGGMFELIDRLQAEERLAGVVLASAKKTFFAGGDLDIILGNALGPQDLLAFVERNKAPLRLLEKLPVPVVAAINGAALGGGFEICLAANHRVIVNDPKAVVGLPEVQLGLLPGAGGVVRLVAKLGLRAALPFLLEGKQLRPDEALRAGLVDEVVASADELIPAAKAWIKAHQDAHAQPWDLKGFKYPGGEADNPEVRLLASTATTQLFAKTRGLAPAPEKILDVAVNSMRMGFESALRAESRGLVALIPSKEAKAAITTFFFGVQAIKAGKTRPAGATWRTGSAAVLGAGMMGSGIAWANAARGLQTVLADVSIEKATKGKGYSETLSSKSVERRQMTAEQRAALLARIAPAGDYHNIGPVDLIIEAVFEDLALKEKVIAETFPKLSAEGIYGSNTSTLPISILAAACPDPSRFVGLHFFSPVDKMKIVEIIAGEKTSADTLRKAYDYVQQIGYMPILVNDSRGFFTSRVFGTYLDEGLALLRDGMDPVAIERAAWKAGMPVGPLAVHDEVSLVLSQRVHETHKALDAQLGTNRGYPADDSSSCAVAFPMLEMGRGGRHYGGGFYDYHADGSKALWPGLAQFRERDLDIGVQEAMDRLIYRQAIETLRCFQEGVLNTEVEANLGSILAIGFPSHTGGALQFIRGVGLDQFKARADELAERYGDRFRVDGAALDKLRPGAIVRAA